MDPAHPKSPFRRGQASFRRTSEIVEGNVSGPFNLSRPFRQKPTRWLCPRRHSCRRGSGWLAHRFRPCHALGSGDSRTDPGESTDSLVPFRWPSHTIKSLRVKSPDLPPSRIFDFILSFPLLEHLDLVCCKTSVDDGNSSGGPSTFVQPSSPPVLTGSLKLEPAGGMELIVGQLLSIPGGIHFRGLDLR